MATLKIWEKQDLGHHEGTVRRQFGPCTQALTFDATDDDSAVLADTTRFVHVQSDADCYIEFGIAPAAAAATSVKLAAGTIYDFAVTERSCKISAVTA